MPLSGFHLSGRSVVRWNVWPHASHAWSYVVETTSCRPSKFGLQPTHLVALPHCGHGTTSDATTIPANENGPPEIRRPLFAVVKEPLNSQTTGKVNQLLFAAELLGESLGHGPAFH